MDSSSQHDDDAGDSDWTIGRLVEEIRRVRTELAQMVIWLGSLDTWASELPRTHVPNHELVTVPDLMPVDADDPHALQHDVLRLWPVLASLRETVLGLQRTAARSTGPFAVEVDVLSDLLIDRPIHVTARLGGPAFDAQRRAMSRAGLMYRQSDRTWRGLLPGCWTDNPAIWSAIAQAGDHGADVRFTVAE